MPPYFSVGRWRPVQYHRAIAAFLRSKHRSKLGIANVYRIRQDGLKYGFQIARRRADYLQYLRSRCQLFSRLVALASELRDIYFLAGSEGTATVGGPRRIALQRLVTFRFYCFAHRFIAPPH